MPKMIPTQGLPQFLEGIDKNSLVVAIYQNSVNVSQEEWLDPLAAHLRSEGFVTIGLIGERIRDQISFDEPEFVSIISPHNLPSLNRINAFILSDMDCWTEFPQSSKVIGFCHAFDPAADTSFPWQAVKPGLLDAYCISFPLSDATKNLTGNLYNHAFSMEHSLRHSQNFHIIPIGYPRMAVLSRELAKDVRQDSIVYAPVEMEYAKERGGGINRVDRYGLRIIRTLLDNFKDYNVIFRPYRMNLQSDTVTRICEAFLGEPRFILDDSSDRAATFARSATVVTDFSHIAQTFAYATLRPGINFEPWNQNSKDEEEFPTGFHCRSFTGLVKTLRKAIYEKETIAEKIRQDRNLRVMPFENAFADIAKLLPAICQGKTSREWITINRYENGELADDLALVARILAQLPGAMTSIAQAMLIFGQPGSALLAAVAYHAGLAHCPLAFPRKELPLLAGKIAGEELALAPFCEIPFEKTRRLYAVALLKAARSGDKKRLAVIERLAAEYDELVKHQTKTC